MSKIIYILIGMPLGIVALILFAMAKWLWINYKRTGRITLEM